MIRISDFPEGFVAVLAGHIHRRQILEPLGGTVGPPIIYPGSIERTSFAEKGESKGFYDLELAYDGSGHWNVRERIFVELPARPMVDIEIDREVTSESVESHLRERISGVDPDAIVRLRADPALGRPVAARLTAAFLRSVFPPGMNVQEGKGIHQDRPRRPRHRSMVQRRRIDGGSESISDSGPPS